MRHLMLSPLGLAALVSSGCTPCNLIACGGGFEWTATAADSSPLPPGDYTVEVSLEGATSTTQCTVVPIADGPSTCADTEAPESDWIFMIHLLSDADDQATGLGFFTQADRDGGTEGPTLVEIVVTRDGAPFIEVEYEPEYVADDDYWGHPSCGSCDSRESAEYTW